jgi:hypothetical protein
MSPPAPTIVVSPTGIRRVVSLYFDRRPYEARVSVASITPSLYFIPSTEVPVTEGDWVWVIGPFILDPLEIFKKMNNDAAELRKKKNGLSIQSFLESG